MAALDRTGRRSEALEVHDELRRVLVEETGSEPGPAIQTLHARIAEPQPATPDGPARLIGREPQLNRLRRAVAELAAGRGGSVWFEGEPGIGKTVLLAEGLRNVTAVGARRGWAAGDELGQRTSLGLLLDCLETAAPDRRTRDRIAAMRDDRHGSGHTVTGLIEDLCAVTPLVLVVDDLHWADDDTLLAWRALHELTAGLPLLLVAASRPEPAHRSLTLLRRVLAEQGAETLAVGPLDEADAAALARRLAPNRPAPDLAAAVADAAGNPYYLQRLVTADGLSPALVAAVGAHLDRYAEDTRQVLRTIAFLGDGCTIGEVAAVTGRTMPDLLHATEQALTGGVLVATSRQQLAFRHPVVGRVLHEGTPTALRIMLHRAVAEKVADAGGSAERVVAQLLAGPVPIDAWAAGWLAEHAEQLAALVPQDAITILRRATTGATADPAIRETLTAWLARVLFWQGDAAEADAGWVAARATDPELVAEMRWVIAMCQHRRAEHVAAVDGILAALRDGSLPERWQERYRLLLTRITPYVAGAPAGPAPTSIIGPRSSGEKISITH
jgi:hypothetical protein